MPEYLLEKAEMDIFAVYQVVYSSTDIEMWFDWNARLDDTKFTDQCYWLLHNGNKIGGAIIDNGTVIYPFIIPPFSDRHKFWEILLKCNHNIAHVNGVTHEDMNILLTLGFKVNVIRQVMCCPADPSKTLNLPDGYAMYALNEDHNVNELAYVIQNGYAGGIDYEMFGVPNETQVIEDLNYLLQVYKHRNLSIYLVNESKKEIVALCIAGISKNIPLGFAEIGELCVLPQYRNKGIAEYMIRHIIATASSYTPVVKLCVTVGNQAEQLYRKVGFHPAPRFAKMSRR